MSRGEAEGRWRVIIAEQSGSGQSVAEFCRRRKLSQVSFYQWRKKLTDGSIPKAVFVPMSLAAATGVSIALPGGAVVQVPPGDERSLAQIVAMLLAAAERRP